jgi:hypothetical protein
MLKKRVIAVVAGLALLVAIAGSAGIVADELGLAVISPAHACNAAGTSGGGC